mmetsp:Transcript_120993/g.353522  ORF Transcript_120993/g.353522 Transcript_120993/m.353522 type:complete len:476 (-) Transcript_120993:51-1478(-)
MMAAGRGVLACPEVAWHKVFSALSLHEVTRAGCAFLSSQAMREAIGSAWDPHAVLCGPWPEGGGGLQPFLAAARATYLSASALHGILPTKPGEKAPEHKGAESRWSEAQPRSVVVSGGVPSALAFSVGHQPGEGLLAMAIGRDIKLVAREELSGCGSVALALPKGCGRVGAVAFSPDSSVLAVVPMSDSGDLAPEVQFYSTDGERAKPVVAKMQRRLSGMDFLHADPRSRSGGDLVAACGTELCLVSPSTGGVVAQWKARAPLAACRAVSPHEVMTLAEKTVEIWDVRTAEGLARSAEVAEVATALDVGAFCSSSAVFLGDRLGGLHRIDWRGTGAPVSELLWSPSAEQRAPCRKLMVERGCACLLTGASLTLLAIEPCLAELGGVDVGEQLSAAASAPGVWAFATQQSVKQGVCSTVSIVDSAGNALYNRAKREALVASAQKSENQKKQKEKKKESQGKKPSCGKAAHGRNSGR